MYGVCILAYCCNTAYVRMYDMLIWSEWAVVGVGVFSSVKLCFHVRVEALGRRIVNKVQGGNETRG